jgi:IMP cyclohydrolase
MYVGRIVAAGMTKDGAPALMYRVSSRSFPDRQIRIKAPDVAVVERTDASNVSHKYIFYECARVVGNAAVVSNGEHTHWIAEKLARGASPRDALVSVLSFMDFEHDELDTPRVAAIVNRHDGLCVFGAVSKEALHVWANPLSPGHVSAIATYGGLQTPMGAISGPLASSSPNDAADEIFAGGIFAELEKPVCAIALVAAENAWQMAVR